MIRRPPRSTPSPPFAKKVLDHLREALGFFVGSGGMGLFLAKVDESERHNIRCDRLLELLIRMPDSPRKEQAVIDLVQQMTTRSMFF